MAPKQVVDPMPDAADAKDMFLESTENLCG